MKKGIAFAIFLFCSLALVSACMGAHSKAPDSSMPELAPTLEAGQSSRIQEDTSQEEKVSKAWGNLSGRLKQLDGYDCLYIITADETVELDGGYQLEFTGRGVQIGMPGNDDTNFYIAAKNPESKLRVYEVAGQGGEPFFPQADQQPVRGKLVHEQSDTEGQYFLRIPCLVDWKDGYCRYGYRYEVEVSWQGESKSFYPIHSAARDNAGQGFRVFTTFHSTYGNKPPAEQENDSAKEDSDADPAEETTAWEYKEAVTMPTPSYSEDEYNYYFLPESNDCIIHTEGFGGYYLSKIDTPEPSYEAIEEKRPIRWISNEAFDPDLPGCSILLGVLTDSGFWRYNPNEASEYIVLLKERGQFTRWFRTWAVNGYQGNYFPERMIEVIAGPNDASEFIRSQPVEAHFNADTAIAKLIYPTTCTILECDFKNFRLDYRVAYNKAFLEQETSTYVTSNADGRYQIWKINERWMHESTTYSYAVYDTFTGHLNDFGALDRFLRLSFIDDHSVALIESVQTEPYSHSEDEDYTEWEKRCCWQTVTRYDLQTGMQQPIWLDLGDLNWAHYIYAYLWDPWNRRHYILSLLDSQIEEGSSIVIKNPEKTFEYNNGGYYLSVFAENGTYLGTYRTGINLFGAKFVRYLPVMSMIDQGTILLQNPLHDYQSDAPYQIDLKNQQIKQELYLPEEYKAIERLLSVRDETFETASEKIGHMLSRWEGNGEKGAQAFEYFLDCLQKNPDAPASQLLYILKEGALIFREELNEVWYLGYDEEAEAQQGSKILQSTYVSDFGDSSRAMWSLPGDVEIIVSLGTDGSDSVVALYTWDSGQGLRPVDAGSVNRITPFHIRQGAHKFYFNAEAFPDVKAYTQGSQLTLTYYDSDREGERAFFHILYQDGRFQAIYPRQEQEG